MDLGRVRPVVHKYTTIFICISLQKVVFRRHIQINIVVLPMEFTSSFLNNLNFVESRNSFISFKIKSFLNLKYAFCRPVFRPLDCAARGDCTIRPTLATPLLQLGLLINKCCDCRDLLVS
jgi:hypothetical protein